MRLLMLFCFMIFSVVSKAQFGVTGFYNINQVEDKQDFEGLTIDNGYEVAAHYWFRLSKRRIEFQPTLYYANHGDTQAGGNVNEIGFQFKINAYLADFAADCDCPTFGKQGSNLQKGFFIQLSPGYARYSLNEMPYKEGAKSTFTLGGGLGLDIGVSNLLTLTPLISARYGFSEMFAFDRQIAGQAVTLDGPSMLSYQIGLQATIRLDKKRY